MRMACPPWLVRNRRVKINKMDKRRMGHLACERKDRSPINPTLAPQSELPERSMCTLTAEPKYGISRWRMSLGLNDFSLWKEASPDQPHLKNKRLEYPNGLSYQTSLSLPLSFLQLSRYSSKAYLFAQD